jgi:hypothetical protein
MVIIFDMVAGRWSDEQDDCEGPGRGGCRRPASPREPQARRAPGLQLALVTVGEAERRFGPGR